MIFKTVVPILYSRDIAASLAYYTDVLGFDGKWAVGNPLSFGAVYKDSVEVFFCKDGQGNPGTWFSIMIEDADEYYRMVKAKGATIAMDLTDMAHGMREFWVEDPDGHVIRFGHNLVAVRERGEGEPLVVEIIERPSGNPAIVYNIVAQHPETREDIGFAQLLGDNAGFFYVKDIFVRPEWRGRGVARQLMRALTGWLDANAPDQAAVWLHSAEGLAPFYKQFGFIPVHGMGRFFGQRD